MYRIGRQQWGILYEEIGRGWNPFEVTGTATFNVVKAE